MSQPVSLLPELEAVIQRGTPGKRAETLKRITDLFLGGASSFNPEHVGLFDDVIGYLIEEIETQALAELSRRIAPVPNAPGGVVQTLASNDNIVVAGPVLRKSPMAETDLKRIAETKSQAHLVAISERAGINEPLTDILVKRGDGNVSRTIASNEKARLSEDAFTTLVQRAKMDGVLAERVGLRSDIPPRLFRQLLLQATAVVQERLLSRAKPETQAEIQKVLAKVSDDVAAKSAPRNFTAALELVRGMHSAGKLTEASIVDFAKAAKQEETLAGLATLCGVPVETVDRLLSGDRYDPIIILARAARFSWETVRSIIASWPGAKNASPKTIDGIHHNFEVLSPVTADRVVRFWQVRPSA